MRFISGLNSSDRTKRLLIALLLCMGGFALFWVWTDIRSTPARQHITRGAEFLQNNQIAAAESQGRAALQLEPHNAQAWELVGDSLLRMRDFKGAQSALEKALQENPDAVGLREKLASCALANGDVKTAEAVAQDELKRNSESTEALLLMANIAKESGKSEEQVEYLQKIITLEPQNTVALARLIDELGRRQDYDKALPLAERLVALQPDASSYYLRALSLFTTSTDAKSLEAAKSDFEKVLELDPLSIEAHRYLGRIALRQNQPQKAITEFEAVGRGRPYASAHLLELSNAYRQVGKAKKADELRALFTRLNQFNGKALGFKRAIQLSPDKVENYLKLGQLLAEGISTDEPLYQLCRYRYVSKDYQSAQYYIDEAKRLQPNSPEVRGLDAEVERIYTSYLRSGLQALSRRDYESATRSLSRAALLRPNDKRTQNAIEQVNSPNFDPLGNLSTTSGEANPSVG